MRLTIDFAFLHVGNVIDHHILDSAFFATHCYFRFPKYGDFLTFPNTTFTVYELTGKQLKEYMEWSANYFDTIQPGDTEYRYNAERKKSKYVTYDIFGGVNYKIDLRNPKGSKICRKDRRGD